MVELQTWQFVGLLLLSFGGGLFVGLVFWLFVLSLMDAAKRGDEVMERRA